MVSSLQNGWKYFFGKQESVLMMTIRQDNPAKMHFLNVTKINMQY